MDRVWLITGASRGIGRALAELVLSEGERVVGTSRDESSLSALEERYPHQCLALTLDVTNRAACFAVVEAAKGRFGQLDVVVPNAGYGLLGAIEECDEAQMRRVMDTHFFGPLFLVQAALPLFRAQGRGHVAFLGAAAAIQNYPGFGVYGGAKAAIETLAESLAVEGAPLGIRTTVVIPGPFRTAFAGNLEPGASPLPEYDPTRGKFATILTRMEGRQPGDPSKAARAILAAISADSPPQRLVLGKYASDKLKKALAAKEAECAAWESVGLPTEFDR